MAYLFEAYLDPRADAAVRDLWDVLKVRDISESNLRNASTPHLTLLTVADLDESAALAALTLVARTPSFSLPLRGLAFFPGERATLYLPVVPLPAFLDLQRACIGAARAAGATPQEARPFTPHVSLARRLRTGDLPKAVGALLDRDLTIDARVVRIGLLRDRPIVRLGQWNLPEG